MRFFWKNERGKHAGNIAYGFALFHDSGAGSLLAAVSDAAHGLQFDFSFLVSGEGSVGFDHQRLRAVGKIEVTIEGQRLDSALLAECIAEGG